MHARVALKARGSGAHDFARSLRRAFRGPALACGATASVERAGLARLRGRWSAFARGTEPPLVELTPRVVAQCELRA